MSCKCQVKRETSKLLQGMLSLRSMENACVIGVMQTLDSVLKCFAHYFKLSRAQEIRWNIIVVSIDNRNYCKTIESNYKQRISQRTNIKDPTCDNVFNTITPSQLELKINGSIQT